MNNVILDLSFPNRYYGNEWHDAMENVVLSKNGLIELIDYNISRKTNWVTVIITGSRLDIVSWLDLLLSLAPNVENEIMALKKQIRIKLLNNHCDLSGNYSVSLRELEREYSTSEGKISKPWFWTASNIEEMKTIKVYLDDERDTPEGWVRCFWPDEVIELLKQGNVSEISLDHDLGDDDRGTGYDVLTWIEEHVFLHQFNPPIMKVHSANSSAKAKMQLAIGNILKMI